VEKFTKNPGTQFCNVAAPLAIPNPVSVFLFFSTTLGGRASSKTKERRGARARRLGQGRINKY